VLDDVIRFLSCPVCGEALRHRGSALGCPGGHSFDVARQGYVNLLPGGARHRDAGTPAMAAARERFLAAGHYAVLADRVAALSHEALSEVPGDACVLDAGAGTGYYLAAVLGNCPGIGGIALDASKYAARRAARAHPRIGAVVADTWQRLPVRSGAAGVTLVVFAPRNPPELHRVLDGRGRLIIVTPGPRHLQEVTEPLGLLRVAGDKDERLAAQLDRFFRKTGQEVVEQRLRLAEADLRSLVMMGPSAWHVPAQEADRRIGRLGGAADVTAAFTVSGYQPVSR
jgi:23S rRNA (guanine745-N1)-methyltransferase